MKIKTRRNRYKSKNRNFKKHQKKTKRNRQTRKRIHIFGGGFKNKLRPSKGEIPKDGLEPPENTFKFNMSNKNIKPDEDMTRKMIEVLYNIPLSDSVTFNKEAYESENNARAKNKDYRPFGYGYNFGKINANGKAWLRAYAKIINVSPEFLGIPENDKEHESDEMRECIEYIVKLQNRNKNLEVPKPDYEPAENLQFNDSKIIEGGAVYAYTPQANHTPLELAINLRELINVTTNIVNNGQNNNNFLIGVISPSNQVVGTPGLFQGDPRTNPSVGNVNYDFFLIDNTAANLNVIPWTPVNGTSSNQECIEDFPYTVPNGYADIRKIGNLIAQPNFPALNDVAGPQNININTGNNNLSDFSFFYNIGFNPFQNQPNQHSMLGYTLQNRNVTDARNLLMSRHEVGIMNALTKNWDDLLNRYCRFCEARQTLYGGVVDPRVIQNWYPNPGNNDWETNWIAGKEISIMRFGPAGSAATPDNSELVLNYFIGSNCVNPGDVPNIPQPIFTCVPPAMRIQIAGAAALTADFYPYLNIGTAANGYANLRILTHQNILKIDNFFTKARVTQPVPGINGQGELHNGTRIVYRGSSFDYFQGAHPAGAFYTTSSVLHTSSVQIVAEDFVGNPGSVIYELKFTPLLPYCMYDSTYNVVKYYGGTRDTEVENNQPTQIADINLYSYYGGLESEIIFPRNVIIANPRIKIVGGVPVTIQKQGVNIPIIEAELLPSAVHLLRPQTPIQTTTCYINANDYTGLKQIFSQGASTLF